MKEHQRKELQKIFGIKDDEYLGNIWGWKFSFISLGIILFATSIVIYAHVNGIVDARTGKPFPKENVQMVDSVDHSTINNDTISIK